ncbi:hypothetical protein HY933_03615 [Candidatus Falkowbacteria bacterium]|nr:hypothetical protein [Candidatus Falkowbacteria bacterium]
MSFFIKKIGLHQRYTIIFVLLGIASFLVFSVLSARLAFVSDEYEFIYAAAQVRDWGTLVQVLTSKIGGDFYRPVLYFSFIIDFWVYGLQPFGYYLTNSLLAAVNVVLVALIVFTALVNYFYSDPRDHARSLFLALVSGVVFMIFPNHHEAVTWLAARTDLLAATWYFLSVLLWLKYLAAERRGGRYLTAGCIFAFLAFFTKEMSVTLVLALPIIFLGHLLYMHQRQQNYNFKKLVGFLPLLAIFIFYLVFRRYIVGYWFGGYMLSGSSEFLKIDIPAVIRLVLSPVSIVFYSLNHSYFFQIVLPRWGGPFRGLPFTDYLQYFKFLFYGGGAVFISLTAFFAYYQQRVRTWLLGVMVGILWVYVTILPIVGLLKTVGLNLESTRFFYLPSLGICFLLTFSVLFWPKIIRGIMVVVMVSLLSIVYWINYQPWLTASVSANSIQQTVTQYGSEIVFDDWVYLVNVPDNIHGAYVFRRGLTQMFQLFQPQIDRQKIIITGRGVAGMAAPDCLSLLSDQYWLMNTDPESGIVDGLSRAGAGGG